MPKGVPKSKVNRAMPLWFFLDDQLHERLEVYRMKDELVAWNYAIGERVVYSLSAVKLRQKPAYRTDQVGAMLGRAKLTMLRYIEYGQIKPPAKGIRGNKSMQQTAYRWSDKDILDAHAFLCEYSNYRGPSRRELIAQLNQEEALYVARPDGTFVPTWKAKDF